MFIHTKRSRSFVEIPESIWRGAGECKAKHCCYATGDAKPQDDVDGNSRLSDREDAVILHTNRNFDEGERNDICQQSPIEIL
jgi:hypothetical protein